MITFHEFRFKTNLILEKYYSPEDKLPSGKTPLQKAKDKLTKFKSSMKANDFVRGGELEKKIHTKVSHGADNPDYNPHHDPDVHINYHNEKPFGKYQEMDIYHRKSGIKYTVNDSNRKHKGKPVHDVTWTHNKDKSDLSNRERIRITRDAKKVWDQHVAHRLPHGSVIANTPDTNSAPGKPNKNTRASLYKKYGGFGDIKDGEQFAEVGREPSPKQKAKGKIRFKPA